MRIRDYITNNFETSETHPIETLRTRYYRARLEDTKAVAKQWIAQEKGKIHGEDEVSFEIVFDCNKYSGTFTIVSPRVGETAVDIQVNTFRFLGMGEGKKIIERMYQYFDKQLTFKGVGLYKGM